VRPPLLAGISNYPFVTDERKPFDSYIDMIAILTLKHGHALIGLE